MTDRSGNEPFFEWPTPDGPAREVWYGLLTHEERPVAFWFRYTLLRTESGDAEARLWAGLVDEETPSRRVFETWADDGHAASVSSAPFTCSVADRGELADDGCSGRVDGDDATIAWDLEYRPDSLTFTPLRDEATMRSAAEQLGTGCHWSANQSVRMTGTLTVDDESYRFTDAPGHQGHTAGPAAPERWNWGHCNTFDDDVAVEVLHLNGRLTPVCLRFPEETYLLNQDRHVFGADAVDVPVDDPEAGVWEVAGTVEDRPFTVRFDATDHRHPVSYRTPGGDRRYNSHCSLATAEVVFDGERRVADGARVEWVRSEPPHDGAYPPFGDG